MSYEYDANGNVRYHTGQSDVVSYQYDSWLNKVIYRDEATLDGFLKTNYAYNASNERMWKQVQQSDNFLHTTETVYLHGDNPWPLVEKETYQKQNLAGTVTYQTQSTVKWHIYGKNGIIATHTNAESIEFPLKDHLGSPRVVLKQTITQGGVSGLSQSGSYAWHPFGGLLESYGDAEPDYGFTGQEKDHESGLHNFRARAYHENLGRFFAVDPQGQYHSPYVYAGNNPFMGTDPDGEFFHLIVGAVIGGTINWIANGGELSWKGLGQFAVGAAAGAIGAGVGAGVTNMIAGKAFSAGFLSGSSYVGVGFGAGSTIGAAAGASSGFVTGMGNSLVNGNSFSNSFSAGLSGSIVGGVSGGVLGGLGGAWNAHKWDRNWLTGVANSTPNTSNALIQVDQFNMSPSKTPGLNFGAAKISPKEVPWLEMTETDETILNRAMDGITIEAKRQIFRGQLLIDAALYVGKSGYSGLCSDFIRALFLKQNIRLPINYANDFENIKGFQEVSDPMSGDIVQWDLGTGGAPNNGHVAVYEGNGKMISTRGSYGTPKTIFRYSISKWSNQSIYEKQNYKLRYLRWFGK